jgi:hypothetical protein
VSKFKEMVKYVTNQDEETNSYSLGKPMKQVYAGIDNPTDKTAKQSIGSNPYLQTGQSFGFVETQRINSPGLLKAETTVTKARRESSFS